MGTFVGLVHVLTQALLLLTFLFGLYVLAMIAVSRLVGAGQRDCAIGRGKVLVEFCLGSTRYQLRAFPIGASFESDTRVTRWRQLLFDVAGPGVLILLAIVTTYVFLVTGVRVRQAPGAFVRHVEGFAGVLEEEDVIVRIDGRDIGDGEDAARELARWESGSLVLEVERAGTQRVVELRRTPEGEERKLLVVRSVTELEYPGPVAAARATPAAIRDIVVYRVRYDLAETRRFGVYVGSQARFVFDFLVYYPLVMGVGLLLEAAVRAMFNRLAPPPPPLSTAELFVQLVLKRDTEPPPRPAWATWGEVIATALAVAALVLGPLLYGKLHPRPLLDTEFILEALRRLPANVYWQFGV